MFHLLPFGPIQAILRRERHFVLLETGAPDEQNHVSTLFTRPRSIIEESDPAKIPSVLERMETLTKTHVLAGFFAYELGNALHHMPISHRAGPLLRLGVFDRPITFDHRSGTFSRDNQPFDPPRLPHPNRHRQCLMDRLRLTPDKNTYCKIIASIQESLCAGESYQTNFTGRYRFRFRGDPLTLYEQLRNSQPTAFNALIRHGNTWIISCSPELFFRIDGNHIQTEPMKGTAARGRTLAEDRILCRNLRRSAKNRAENCMIVDLIRSDLGSLCTIGSVRTSSLCKTMTLPSALQMTTTVRGTLRSDVTWASVLSALFPCGSVTGAPKLRTMEIIAAHEASARGVYCGAIGFLTQKNGKREATFSVPIRTTTIEPQRKSRTLFRGTLGSGGGILVESEPRQEWEELRLKARFLTHPLPPFQLVETLLLTKKTFPFIKAHLSRLRASAEYWQFPMDESGIRKTLHSCARKYPLSKNWKVRLLLDRSGSMSCTASVLPSKRITPGAIAFSKERTDSRDPFLFHKTTHRPLYLKARTSADSQHLDDIIFCNERGEVTEGTIANLIIDRHGKFLTPPTTCGLLPGVFRNRLIRQKKLREAVLRPRDIETADRIFLCNAVRGMWEVTLAC